MDANDRIIQTNLFKSSDEYLNNKRLLIDEAILFPTGTKENGKETIVFRFGENKKASFFKPGKEATRKIPNIYDMYPAVFVDNVDVTEKYSFQQIWEN